MNVSRLLPCLLAGVVSAAMPTAETKPLAQMNWMGFDTKGAKSLVLPKPESGTWYTGTWKLLRSPEGTKVAEGAFPTPATWSGMGSDQFMLIQLPDTLGAGSYLLADDDVATGKRLSRVFTVKDRAYLPVVKALVKGFYYWRASTPIDTVYGGAWGWRAGHPDNNVTVYDQPARKISAPGGWYDAGDYGKYVVNAGISAWSLGQVADLLPGYTDTLNWNIPKIDSLPTLPGLINELKWEADWLLNMQDTDGGVWNKLTTWVHAGTVMPANDRAQRFALPKSTAATFNFIAVLAQMSRLMRPYSPLYVARCSTAAEKAWAWTVKNPAVLFPNTITNADGVKLGTGWYDVSSAAAESQPRFFAAMEMVRLTGSDRFVSQSDLSAWTTAIPKYGIQEWANMGMLGTYAMLLKSKEFPASLSELVKASTALINTQANTLKSGSNNGYGIPLDSKSFYWGSNGAVANKGMLLMNQWRATGDSACLRGAQALLDYLMGRNPINVSFVTGLPAVSATDTAHHYPVNIHHRQSESDDVDEPVPGYLSGGPNSNGGDQCVTKYANTAKPALSWLDDACSYASNEVAINWNAPMFNLAAQLDEAYSHSTSTSVLPGGSRRMLGAKLSGNDLMLPAGDAAMVSLMDLNGRELSRFEISGSPNVRGIKFSTSGGLSLVVVRQGNQVQVLPVIGIR